ncbi:MAG: HAMP domain-containing histidine kinase [Acidimicrobiia bacterium]|nr:HAMP domain-containing histidine kinase [Acidimicrobiia bacterium]
MTNRRDHVMIASALVASSLIVAVAVVFSASVGGSNISAEALAFAHTESAIAAVTTTQGAVQRAVAISQVVSEQQGKLVEIARITISTSHDRFLLLHHPGVDILPGSTDYLNTASAVLNDLEVGDIESAAELVADPMAGQFEVLVGRLVEERDALGSNLQSLDEQAVAAAQATRFMIGLAIPLAVAVLVLTTYRRRETQRTLEKQVEYERELRKSRDDFIANVSHELRTPLTAVFGFAQLLDSGLVDEREERDDLIRLIYGESGELVRMVEDLLTAARLTEGGLAYRLEPVNVFDEVGDVAEVISRMGTTIEIRDVDGHVRADRLRFRQIVRNLLANAARYGGDSVVISGRAGVGSYELVVADNGGGVPYETTATMFERFSQYEDASLARGGLGLGLSIVQALLEDMGGTIGYERVDGWSRFVIELPTATEIRGLTAERVLSTAPSQVSTPDG